MEDQRRRSWSTSAFPLLLDLLFSSWKWASLSLLFVVDVSLESFIAFCIQCQLQLQLCCEFRSFIPEWFGGTVLLLGHLILLTHLVHFLLCLSPASSSECILAGLFSFFPAYRDCSGLRRLSFKTDYLSSVLWPKGSFCGILPTRTLNKLEFPFLNPWFSLLHPSTSSKIFSFTISQLLEPSLSLATKSGQSFLVCELGYQEHLPWVSGPEPVSKRSCSRNFAGLLMSCLITLPRFGTAKSLVRARAWYHETPSTCLSTICILD